MLQATEVRLMWWGVVAGVRPSKGRSSSWGETIGVEIKISEESGALLSWYGNLSWSRGCSIVFVECSLGHPSEGKEGRQVQEYGEAEAVEGHGEVVGAHAQQHNIGHCWEHRTEALSPQQGNHVIPLDCENIHIIASTLFSMNFLDLRLAQNHQFLLYRGLIAPIRWRSES